MASTGQAVGRFEPPYSAAGIAALPSHFANGLAPPQSPKHGIIIQFSSSLLDQKEMDTYVHTKMCAGDLSFYYCLVRVFCFFF